MANLLYHWNFTSNTTVSNALNNKIYDDIANLEAKVIARNSSLIISSTVTRDSNGITLINKDSINPDSTDEEGNPGICIDLLGLDSVNLGGDITIEMVIKNTDLNRQSIYFQTIRDVDNESNNDSAFITAKYNDDTMLLVRPTTKNITGWSQRKIQDSSDNINNTDFFHYVFTIKYNPGDSSIKIFINGVEKGKNTNTLIQELSNTLRQSNLIGCQKNPVGSTYLNGTVKYLKIYQNAMTDDEVVTAYDNSQIYSTSMSDATNEEKFTKRHTEMQTYFDNNPTKSSIGIIGNQLGLLNSTETYIVHKFINASSIDISNGFHYVPLTGINNFIIFKNDSTWYKITQTSNDNGASTLYKYEISNNNGNSYSSEVSGKTFGDSLTDGNITIGFGGAESGAQVDVSNICFLGDALVHTDQGILPIKKITRKNSIFGLKVLSLIKVKNMDDYMIFFRKNSLGTNVPSEDIYISKNHHILINNCYIQAKFLVNGKNIIV